MTPREKKLLSYLLKCEDWITSAELAERLSISKRSIKSYIKNINQEADNIILASANGYRINEQSRARSIIENSNNTLPQDKDERSEYILRQLLLKDEKQSLMDLADTLFISYATLISELPNVKNKLSKYKLSLKTKNDYMYIEGNVKDEKRMISDLLYEEMKKGNGSLYSIGHYFTSIDLSDIGFEIRQIIKSRQLYLDDLTMVNLLLHLAITAERCKQFSGDNGNRTKLPENTPLHVVEIAKEISELIMKKHRINFSDSDINDVAILISTRLTKEYIDESTTLDSRVKAILEKIKERLQYVFGIDVDNRDFEIRFGIHISNMLKRLENGNRIRNLELDTIKINYPVIYDVAVFISDLIENETAMAITEDEIAYIALHLGVLYEEETIRQEKVNIILLYPPYGNGRDEMLDKINKTFEDSAIVTKVISSLDEISKDEKYDLIIASTLIPSNLKIKQIGVGKHLGTKDLLVVADAIEKIKEEKERSKISSRLDKLFREDLFFYDPGFNDSKEAIDFLCNVMKEKEIVDDNYRDSVYKREEISSCGYDKVAIPHPLDVDSPITAIAVSIHPNGFFWNNYKVYIVFMLAINHNDNVLFKDVFEYTTYMLASTNGLKSILKAKTYDEFIRVLADSNVRIENQK